jgi:hypothetical protein
MKSLRVATICTLAAVIAACQSKEDAGESATDPKGGIPTTTTEVAVSDLPPDLLALVSDAVPGIQVEGAERKEREGRVYYDVEGQRADGTEVELDVLKEATGYSIVEIQRDMAWSEVPDFVRSAAAASEKPFEPVRVIESKQTDGSVIYELFAQGVTAKPSLEVRVVDGKAEVLKEEWKH